MRTSDLKKAYTPVPDGFHDALFAAAHSVKEEKQLKHTFRAAAIALIVTALLCGTALALTSLYSLRDTWDGSPRSEEFLNHVLDIHQAFENERIKLTVTDAVFDGQQFEVAIDLQSPDPQKPVYIYPRLEAACGGQPIGVDIEGMTGDFLSGFLYPNAVTGDMFEGRYGFSGVIYDKNAAGDVTFTLTLKLLMPNWPVSDAETNHGTDLFADAYQNQKIYTVDGDGLVEYSWGAAKAMGMREEEQNMTRTGDLLEKSGAFTLMDTVTCVFTMPVPKSFASTVTVGGEIPFGEGLALRVERLAVSFMRVEYDFLIIPESDKTWEEAHQTAYKTATHKAGADPELYALIQSATTDFTVADEKGSVLSETSGHQVVELEGGGWAVSNSGSLEIKGTMPKQLTFTPSNGQTALTFGLNK